MKIRSNGIKSVKEKFDSRHNTIYLNVYMNIKKYEKQILMVNAIEGNGKFI